MNSTGTYDLQTINVYSIAPSGTMRVVLQYMTNSSATGCLLILSQGQYTRYHAVRKPAREEIHIILVEGLPQGHYIVRGYDVGRQTLSYDSVAMAAVTSQNVSLEQGTAFWNQGNCTGSMVLFKIVYSSHNP